jgi:hypothetical protein
MKTTLRPRTKHFVFRRPPTVQQRRGARLAVGILLCLAFAKAFTTKVEGASLIVALPATAMEDRGTMTNAGTILLSGTLPTNLVVSLESSDPTMVTVPPTMTIIAGQIGGAFSITIVDDLVVDGNQTNTVTASAPGFVGGSDTIVILDNESPPVPSNPIPANLAVNVQADTELAWQPGAVGITNDIYFGTSTTPRAIDSHTSTRAPASGFAISP